ncbi:MAG TPA: hypothetical protein VK856_04275 [Anaerolineaceae bacterium]|nr:hypothetical protein [Anaerolineaceae bacterium]
MNFSRKVFGSILIGLSIIGLLISVFALVQVWRFRLPVATQIYDSLIFTEKVVETSISGLNVVDSSLTNIRTSLNSLEESTLLMAQSMEDTSNLISNFTVFFRTDLKQTLENTKLSVVAAQSSALIIDNLLYGMSRIPFLGIAYEPPKPLNEALKEIGETLNDMPESMDEISVNLTDNNKNLRSLKDGIDEISLSMASFQTDLLNAQNVINDYLTDLTAIKASVLNAQQKIFNWSIWAAILLSILIILIGVTQVAAITQGYEMFHYQRNLEGLIESKIIAWEKAKSLPHEPSS